MASPRLPLLFFAQVQCDASAWSTSFRTQPPARTPYHKIRTDDLVIGKERAGDKSLDIKGLSNVDRSRGYPVDTAFGLRRPRSKPVDTFWSAVARAKSVINLGSSGFEIQRRPG